MHSLSTAIKQLFVCLVTFASLLPAAYAQDTDSQEWTMLVFNARFKRGVRIYAEMQGRVTDDYHHLSLFVIRPALGFQVSHNVSLWAGYARFAPLTSGGSSEDRPYQQLLVEDRYPGLDVTNRTRLEERLITRAGGISVRLRHQLRASHPLDARRRFALVGFDELFWNLTDTPGGPQRGFDQNRTYIGFAFNATRHTRLEIGYRADFVNPPRGRPNRRLDVLLLALNYNL